MKELWDYLLKAAAAALTGERLQEAGATPAEAALGPTVYIPITTTFSAPVGPPPGLEESRDVAHLHPELQRRYALVDADYQRETGRQLFPTCTYRSPRKQGQLYAQGRDQPGSIVTNCDGVTKKSRHNVYPSQAIDVCVDTDPGPGKHPVWDREAYAPLGPIAARHGLVWGGGWKSIHDDPHLELPAEAA